MKLTIGDLKQKNCIIFECISGSKAYGLDLPESDTDIKGVFILPEEDFYGFEYIPQVNDETNDTVYYEIKRFLELCYKNNPTILEMLYTPKDKILLKSPLFDLILKISFLTLKAEKTFAGYASTQIKKAKGLKKKIFNPVEKEKKSVLHFCSMLEKNGSVSLFKWLEDTGFDQSKCGLSKINGWTNMYALYYGDHNAENVHFNGICRKEDSGDITLSCIPKGMKIKGYLYFNPDDYSRYCKEYQEYWNWVNNRNEARYNNTINHKKNYDAKNMMHTFRLLLMAEEIAREGTIHVKRPDRDFLLKIRRGEYEYADLITMAEDKISDIKKAFCESGLPEDINPVMVENLLVEIRKAFYGNKQ